MQTVVTLPRLELTMDNVRVAAVRIALGEQVTADQPLIEVETGKSVEAVPSPKPGFIRGIFVNPDDRISENGLICAMTDTADEVYEDPSASKVEASQATPKDEPASPRNGGPQSEYDAVGSGVVKAVPAARKLAKDLGLDLRAIVGSGPGGRITFEDVRRTGAMPAAAGGTEAAWEQVPPARLALMAQMQRSLAEIPQIHIARQMAVGALLTVPSEFTFTVRLIRCIARALQNHRRLRTVLQGDKTRVVPVSVAVAMETSRGLVAPALRDVDLQELERIRSGLTDLKRRAEAGSLRTDEVTQAPFALSNLGGHEVDFFSAFVFHGQTAVLAVGHAREGKAWFNLAADHRIVDGADAARFLADLQEEIVSA